MRIHSVLVLSLGICALGGAVWAGDFWKDRKPADWSDKEKQRLLHSSPWAREAAAEMNMTEGGLGGPMGGGMMGGPPGGGMGGPGGGGPGGPGGMEMTALVRWESAAPVQAAGAKPLSAEAEDHYVISVTGIPIFATRPRREGGAPEVPPEEGGASASTTDPERRAQLLATVREATSLNIKGRSPIIPDNVIANEEEGILLIFFPKDDNPIRLSDKNVTFKTIMGPIELKQKFELKEMVFDGKLAL